MKKVGDVTESCIPMTNRGKSPRALCVCVCVCDTDHHKAQRQHDIWTMTQAQTHLPVGVGVVRGLHRLCQEVAMSGEGVHLHSRVTARRRLRKTDLY